MRRPRVGIAVSALGVMAVMALGGCSGQKTFDQADLQKQTVKSLEKQTGQDLKAARCPKDVKYKKGTTFRCTLVFDDNSEIGMTGTVTNDKGKFDIKVDDQISKPPNP